MRAIVVDRWMSHRDLAVCEVPEPLPGPGEVVVEVRAAACNFFDTLIVKGEYQVKPPLPFTPGGELAGVVASLGPEASGVEVGARVVAQLPYGAYAERVAVPARALRPIADGVSFEQAAALPIVYGTSYAALVERAAIAEGETLLVHAGAGGVGTAAIQIGRALGARVIATAGGPDKLDVARKAGAEVAVDYRAGDFTEAVMDFTDGRGADVIYDSVGGDTTDRSLRCIAWNGRLLIVGFASGHIPEIRANRVMLKNVSVVGVHWSAYPERDPAATERVFEALRELHAAGRIAPVIFGTYRLEDVAKALEALGSRASFGKIVIVP